MLPIKGKTNDSFPPAKPLPAPGSRRFHLCIAGRKLSEMSGGAWGGAHLLAALLRTWQTGSRCTAAWEAAAVGLTGEARQMKAPCAPAYAKVNANLRGAQSPRPLCMRICLPTLRFPCPSREQPPCSPRAPLGRGGAAGVMLHACRKPLIKLEISDRGCRSNCAINHRAAG